MRLFVWKRWVHHIVPMKFIEQLLGVGSFLPLCESRYREAGRIDLRLSGLKQGPYLLCFLSSWAQKGSFLSIL